MRVSRPARNRERAPTWGAEKVNPIGRVRKIEGAWILMRLRRESVRRATRWRGGGHNNYRVVSQVPMIWAWRMSILNWNQRVRIQCERERWRRRGKEKKEEESKEQLKKISLDENAFDQLEDLVGWRGYTHIWYWCGYFMSLFEIGLTLGPLLIKLGHFRFIWNFRLPKSRY